LPDVERSTPSTAMAATPRTHDTTPNDGLGAAYTLLGHRPLIVDRTAFLAARDQARRPTVIDRAAYFAARSWARRR
jgi:hypothetical protein